MMIDPPIDKLIKMAPCRYALVCGLAKRATELTAMNSPELEASGLKPLSFAAKEIYDGKIKVVVDDEK